MNMKTDHNSSGILKTGVLYFLAIWMVSENIIGSYVYNRISPLFGFLVYLKYILFFGFALLGVFYSRSRFKMPDIFAILYIFWVFSVLFITYLTDIPVSNYAYLYVNPIIVYFSGKYFYDQRFERFIEFIVKVTVYMVAFGFFDYYIMQEYFWRDFLRYADYISYAKGFEDTILDDLPGNFYYDPYAMRVRRMVSTMGDPLALGYFLFFVLTILNYTNKHKSNIVLVSIIFLGLIMTLTRAAILAYALTIRVVFINNLL